MTDPFLATLLRPEADTVAQDWERLAAYLAERGMHLETDPAPRQFAGGFANLNYLVRIDGGEAVLRRPPMGPLPPGAYDMGRESKILSRLHEQYPLAPRALHLCEDDGVLGAPFQITEFRRGISCRSELPSEHAGDPAVGEQLGAMLVDRLAELHRVEPAAVDLDDLGKPDGFLERAVRGWRKRANLAIEGWGTEATRKRIERVGEWLDAHRVPDGPASLIHNDFKLDNLLLDPKTLEPVALVDWDQGTRGDGLFDLATLLSYWVRPGDPECMHRMAQMPTDQPGFPSREDAAQRYARATGRDLADFRFHRALATFKTAVIFQQLCARWHNGGTRDPQYATLGDLADGLLDMARDIIDERTF